MKHRRKLFMSKNIYDLTLSDGIFLSAMKANVALHLQKCPAYAEVLKNFGFSPDMLNGIEDLYKLPPLPTSYLKNHTLLSKPYEKLFIKTTSSGTGGRKTLSGFDFSSALCALSMVLKVFGHHKMISLRPTNYIILGYQPGGPNESATAKALQGVVALAPPKIVHVKEYL